MTVNLYYRASYHHNNLTLAGGLRCLVFILFMPLSYIQAQQANPPDNQVIKEFNEHLNQYIKLRGQAASKLEKPSNKSVPTKVKAYQNALEESLRTARAEAQQGNLFTPEVAEYIRQVIRQGFQGKKLQKLRKEVAEAQTKGVLPRVNYPYPEQKEFVKMPPTLLLQLPPLPQELRYRFVGSDLLLVDREALLIIDYMNNALP